MLLIAFRKERTAGMMVVHSCRAATFAVLVMLGSDVFARPQATETPMGFFVTSVGSGNGGNLGGIVGADRRCQTLATAAGGGNRIWRAYLSTQGPNAVSARERIGPGPWYNAKGVLIARNVSELHGGPAGRGPNITKESALTEKGEVVSGRGDSPNRHDILTGTQPDGTAYRANEDRTCRNWHSRQTGSAQVGHHDVPSGTAWNSAHPSKGCSQDNLRSTGGNGLFYCFAFK
jgi:hypothetical protein